MFNNFYHRLIRKYVVLFGTLFNEIYIDRLDEDGVIISSFKIPLTYGPKEKVLARLDQDPNLNRPDAITLPRISFEITNLQYANERKLPTINKFAYSKNSTDTDRVRFVYNPVPYDIDFQLNIMVKNTEDGTRIVEQILPYFTPDWTPTVTLMSDPEIKMDIPIILKSVSMQDDYEGDFETRRVLVWTLNFTLKGYLFGPARKAKIVKFVEVNSADLDIGRRYSSVQVEPGLTANGLPTQDETITIDSSLIDFDDNWGYIVTVVDRSAT